jgi:hypothetical protein
MRAGSAQNGVGVHRARTVRGRDIRGGAAQHLGQRRHLPHLLGGDVGQLLVEPSHVNGDGARGLVVGQAHHHDGPGRLQLRERALQVRAVGRDHRVLLGARRRVDRAVLVDVPEVVRADQHRRQHRAGGGGAGRGDRLRQLRRGAPVLAAHHHRAVPARLAEVRERRPLPPGPRGDRLGEPPDETLARVVAVARGEAVAERDDGDRTGRQRGPRRRGSRTDGRRVARDLRRGAPREQEDEDQCAQHGHTDRRVTKPQS